MPSPNRLACALILATAVAGAASAQPAEQTITVTLTNYAFTPKVIHLHHGVAYQLRLTNTSDKGHDFEAYELFENSRISTGPNSKARTGRLKSARVRAWLCASRR
jgi:Cupredoxin-like domain